MRPAARVQAAIEIVDRVIASVRDNGPPADAIVRDYFRTRRYAGSKDRRAVREYVFAAIRRHPVPPADGRVAMLGLAEAQPEIRELFDGSEHGPAPIAAAEVAPPAGAVPDWLEPHLSKLVGEEDRRLLLERAPLDLRTNVAQADRHAMVAALEGEPTPHSPWGVRLPTDTRIDDSAAYKDGLVEIQDEASQLVALACAPGSGEIILDLCAGAGGKSLALAAMGPEARIIAADIDKRRLGQLTPRAERAAAQIETRLLDPPREREALADLEGQVDCVLIDAPCSGSGTWRRSPELRWRLTSGRLDTLTEVQGRLLELAAPLVKPGGRIVYAVCSLLDAEGPQVIERFASNHSDFSCKPALDSGRKSGLGTLLTPAHDATDGFFVAALEKAC